MGSGVLKGDRRIQRIHLSGVVGVFHLSCKIADLSLIAVSQYQENISPISGALHKRGKYSVLGRIILGSMRWNSFTAFGVMMIAYMLAEPLL